MTVGVSASPHMENYTPPDGGWGWVIVFASFVIHFIMDGIIYSLGTYLPAFIEDFGVSHGEASLVHSLLPAITLSTGPLASWFTNAYGCRLTTLIGSAIASVGFFLSFFVTKFYFLYVTVGCIVGIGFGLVYVPAIVSVGYYFEKKRSLAIGIAVCGAGVGTFILSPLNRVLEESYGIRGAFLVKSAIVLNMFVCGCLIRPAPVEPSEIKKTMREEAKKKQQRHLQQQQQQQQQAQSPRVSSVAIVAEEFSLPVNLKPELDSLVSDAKSSTIAITVTDPLSVSKSPKIGDSLPAIHIKNIFKNSSLKISSTSAKNKSPPLVINNSNSNNNNNTKMDNNNETSDTTNFLRIDPTDPTELIRSMPMLTMTTSPSRKNKNPKHNNHRNKNNNNNNNNNNTDENEDALKRHSKIKSMNSALDIMAHIRSLQSIHLYNPRDDTDDEESENNDKEVNKNEEKTRQYMSEDNLGGGIKCVVIDADQIDTKCDDSNNNNNNNNNNNGDLTGVGLVVEKEANSSSYQPTTMTVTTSDHVTNRSGSGWLSRTKSKLGRLTHELDLSLFRNSVFLFFALSNFLTSLGFNTPFIYIVDQATLKFGADSGADLLLSTIGISNTVGRVILGLISDMKNINRLNLYAALLTICGLATIVEPFLNTYAGYFAYAVVFGVTSGGYVSLTSVLLVDLLGLEKLTNAFGILLVFQGIATLLGPPSAGILFDVFHTYTIPFVITGVVIGVSGFMCFFIPCIKNTSPNDNNNGSSTNK